MEKTVEQLELSLGTAGLEKDAGKLKAQLRSLEKEAGKVGQALSKGLTAAAKALKPVLAGFDEIERLEFPKSGSGGGKKSSGSSPGAGQEDPVKDKIPYYEGLAAAIGKAEEKLRLLAQTGEQTGPVPKAPDFGVYFTALDKLRGKFAGLEAVKNLWPDGLKAPDTSAVDQAAENMRQRIKSARDEWNLTNIKVKTPDTSAVDASVNTVDRQFSGMAAKASQRQIKLAPPDTGAVEQAVEQVGGKFSALGDLAKNALKSALHAEPSGPDGQAAGDADQTGGGVLDRLTTAFSQLGGVEGIGQLFGALTQGFGQVTEKARENTQVTDLWAQTGGTGIAALMDALAQLTLSWSADNAAAAQARTGVTEQWSPVAGWFQSTVVEPLASFFTGLWSKIVDLASGAWNGVCGAWNAAAAWFQGMIVVPVTALFSGLWEGITAAASAAWSGVQVVWNGVTGFFENIGATVQGIFDAVGAALQGDFSGAWEAIQGVFDGWGEFFTGLWDDMTGVFSDAWETFTGIGDRVVQGIMDGISSAWDGLTSWFNDIWNSLFGGRTATVTVNKRTVGGGGTAVNPVAARVQLPPVPQLARGAVLPANRPFLAVVGDQRNGTNVEAPLSAIQDALALALEDRAGRDGAMERAELDLLRQILQAVLGIRVGDETIGRAARRYERKMAVMNGGLL